MLSEYINFSFCAPTKNKNGGIKMNVDYCTFRQLRACLKMILLPSISISPLFILPLSFALLLFFSFFSIAFLVLHSLSLSVALAVMLSLALTLWSSLFLLLSLLLSCSFLFPFLLSFLASTFPLLPLPSLYRSFTLSFSFLSCLFCAVSLLHA